MFCVTCDVTCCLLCLDETHHGHTVTDKDAARESKMASVTDMIQRIQRNIAPDMKRKMEAIREGRRKNKREFKEVINRILDQGDDLRLEIDDIVNEYVDECEMMRKRNDDFLADILKSYEKSEKEIHGYLSVCLEATASSQLPKLTEAVKICNECVEQALPKRTGTKLVPPIFAQGQIDTDVLKSNIGQLELPKKTTSENSVKSTDQRQILSEFVHKTPFQLRSLCTTGKGSVWIGCWDHVINMMDQSGTVLRSVYCKVTVMDMCVGEGGCVWLVCDDSSVRRVVQCDVTSGTSSVPMVTVNGCASGEPVEAEITTVFHTEWMPYSVCTCPGGLLCISMSMCTITNSHVGKLAKYRPNGVMVDFLEHDSKGQILLEKPQRIAISSPSSLVALVDFPQSVVLLNKDFSFCFRYTDDKNGFSPCDVTFDLKENMLICDSGSRSIIMVNKSGVPTRNVMKFGGVNPTVIACDAAGNLWVGLEDKTIKVIKYKS